MATRVSSPRFIGRQAELQTLTEAARRATEAAAVAARLGLDREEP